MLKRRAGLPRPHAGTSEGNSFDAEIFDCLDPTLADRVAGRVDAFLGQRSN